MTRTISQLTAGQIVYLDEYIDGIQTPTSYIYLGLDESSNCVLLRKYAVVAKRMNATNDAVYDGCEMDLWLENETDGYLSRFDAPTLASIISTQIKCNNIVDSTIVTLARRCFLLSQTEIGNGGSEGISYLDVLKTVADTTNNNTARIAYNEALTAVYWWLRSASGATQFNYVNNGYINSNNASYSYYWARPALAVAPATIVSDETEDTIYLLPDSSKTYREIKATIQLGTSIARINKVKITCSIENCYDISIYVSNNAKDTAPVWVAIENGGTAELTNSTKETDEWELGVKFSAKSNGRGIISEPVVIALTD